VEACDKVCGKTKGRRDQGNTWWWNEDVKDAITNKKMAYRKLCANKSVENRLLYTNLKNRTKK